MIERVRLTDGSATSALAIMMIERVTTQTPLAPVSPALTIMMTERVNAYT